MPCPDSLAFNSNSLVRSAHNLSSRSVCNSFQDNSCCWQTLLIIGVVPVLLFILLSAGGTDLHSIYARSGESRLPQRVELQQPRQFTITPPRHCRRLNTETEAITVYLDRVINIARPVAKANESAVSIPPGIEVPQLGPKWRLQSERDERRTMTAIPTKVCAQMRRMER